MKKKNSCEFLGYSFRINTSETATHTGICAIEGRSEQNIIQRVESLINYQTAHDKDSSVSRHTPQVPVISSVASNYYNGSASNYWSGMLNV